MRRTVLLIFVAFLCASASPAHDKLIVPEDTAPIQLCPDCTTITVLLKPDNSQIQLTEQPQIAGLFLSGGKKNSDGFSAKWIGKTRPQSIEITLDLNALVHSGTYDLYLDLQPRSNPAAERLRVQILHPEPKLKSMPKLLIDRTYYFFGWQDDSLPQLSLVESSNLSNFTNVRIERLTNATLGSKQIGGTLEFTKPPVEIKAGRAASFDYRAANDFGLGTASGSLNIAAAETNDPIGTIDFEVRSHLHWIYIGVPILLGLVVSFFLKVHLQQKLELDQASLDARRLLERVRDFEGKHLDPVFRKAYGHAAEALETALNGTDPLEINTAKTQLDTDWRAAVQGLMIRHQDQETALNKLRGLTSMDWLVPPSIRTLVETTKDDLPLIQDALDEDDLVEAADRLPKTLTKLGDGIRKEALDWQLGVTGVLDQLEKGPLGISKSVGEKLEKLSPELRTSLNRVSATTPLSTTEQIQQALADLKAERTAVTQFGGWLKQALSTQISAVAAEGNALGTKTWKSDIFDILPKAQNNFEGFLSTVADSPEPEQLPSLLQDLHAAWIRALQSQFSAPLQEMKQLLEAREYEKAAETAIHELKKNNDMLGETDVKVPLSFRVPGFSRDASPVFAVPTYVMHTHFQTLFTPDPVARTSVTEKSQLQMDKLQQSALIGLIVVIFGYTMQLSTFVGTFAELSTLFFWAFGLDLTLDTLKTLSVKKA